MSLQQPAWEHVLSCVAVSSFLGFGGNTDHAFVVLTRILLNIAASKSLIIIQLQGFRIKLVLISLNCCFVLSLLVKWLLGCDSSGRWSRTVCKDDLLRLFFFENVDEGIWNSSWRRIIIASLAELLRLKLFVLRFLADYLFLNRSAGVVISCLLLRFQKVDFVLSWQISQEVYQFFEVLQDSNWWHFSLNCGFKRLHFLDVSHEWFHVGVGEHRSHSAQTVHIVAKLINLTESLEEEYCDRAKVFGSILDHHLMQLFLWLEKKFFVFQLSNGS